MILVIIAIELLVHDHPDQATLNAESRVHPLDDLSVALYLHMPTKISRTIPTSACVTPTFPAVAAESIGISQCST